MTLAEFEQVLTSAVNRSDKEAEGWYPKWVNRALRQVQKDRSWNCMFKTTELTIASGASGVAMPSDFKELHSALPAVFVKEAGVGSGLIPVEVTTRAEVSRFDAGQVWPTAWSSATGSNLQYFLESAAAGGWSLNINDPATQDIVLKVHYFGFLPDLAADGDYNFLTTEYPDMCLAKVKEIAFTDINDPIAVDFMTIYREKFRDAAIYDSRIRYSGRRVRMGG